MIRKLSLLLFIFLIAISVSRSQDIFNCDNSLRYANHLLNTNKYKLATEEFERILYICNTDENIKHLLLKSYILDGQFEKALNRTDSLFSDNLSVSRDIAIDYTYALLLSGKFRQSENYIPGAQNLLDNDRRFFRLNSQLLSYQWSDASTTFSSMNNSGYQDYKQIFSEIDNARYKKYAIAVGLSAIVPGMGKVYSGDWKDGIVSFIFVAGFTAQAIRGYNIYGNKSGHFIGYTSLAGAFYLSNLYGTYRSVRKHNESTKQKIHNRIRSTFISFY